MEVKPGVSHERHEQTEQDDTVRTIPDAGKPDLSKLEVFGCTSVVHVEDVCTSKRRMIKKVANDSVANGDRVVIVLLEGRKNAQANHIKNRIKAIAGLTVTQALILWPWLHMSLMVNNKPRYTTHPMCSGIRGL